MNQTPSNGNFASQNIQKSLMESQNRQTTMMSSPLLPPVDATGPCDRRLSRAARQILQEQLVPLLEQWLLEEKYALPIHRKEEKISKYFPTSLAPTYLWDILERTANSDCPLHPFRDVHYELENESLVSVPRAPKLAPRKTYPHWYHCGICGKVFGTRYYLDIHQHAAHGSTSLSNNEEQKSCIATTVCGALGGCDRMATVDLEPHYGRGSGEGGDQARSVQRAWATSHMDPCQEEVVQSQMKPACFQLMQDCFGNSDAEDSTATSLQKQLQEALCEPLSCHTLLHRQEWMHRHLAKGLWRRQLVELQHVHKSTAVIVVLIFLLLYYLIVVVGCSERGSHGGGSGSRTLSASNNKKSARSFWSRLFRRKVKKKSL
jgi:hypothetical protein